jgi:nitrogenase subunit NifH
MVDRRRSLHKETIAELRSRFPMILATEVPYGSEFERMATRRAPIESYAPASAAAGVYRALWREIDERLSSGANVRVPDDRRSSTAPPAGATQASATGLPDLVADTELVGSPWSAGRE